MHVHVMTLFPQMFPGALAESITGRALEKNLWSLHTHNPRDFATDPHKTVDDTPAGGGAGMVMRADVLERAFLSIPTPGRRVYLSPRGRVLSHSVAQELSVEANMTLLCGRYEGVDQRFLDVYDFEEISIGNYVLTGGELPAIVLLDTVIRLLPGVVGKPESLAFESHTVDGQLEHPHYTRPNPWVDAQGREHAIPSVLTSGHHGEVARWRAKETKACSENLSPNPIK